MGVQFCGKNVSLTLEVFDTNETGAYDDIIIGIKPRRFCNDNSQSGEDGEGSVQVQELLLSERPATLLLTKIVSALTMTTVSGWAR
jgi:hypothetical protein